MSFHFRRASADVIAQPNPSALNTIDISTVRLAVSGLREAVNVSASDSGLVSCDEARVLKLMEMTKKAGELVEQTKQQLVSRLEQWGKVRAALEHYLTCFGWSLTSHSLPSMSSDDWFILAEKRLEGVYSRITGLGHAATSWETSFKILLAFPVGLLEPKSAEATYRVAWTVHSLRKAGWFCERHHSLPILATSNWLDAVGHNLRQEGVTGVPGFCRSVSAASCLPDCLKDWHAAAEAAYLGVSP